MIDMTGYRKLISSLNSLREQSLETDITLGSLVSILGDSGFSLIAFLIALPCLQPFVPLGPYSTGAALSIIILGIQQIQGFSQPHLPGFLARMPVTRHILNLIIVFSLRFYRRHRRTFRSGKHQKKAYHNSPRTAGGILLGSGCVMIVPFFGIPLNDFFPALAIVSLGLGELEKNRFMIMMAFLWLIVAVIYCIALLTIITLFGWHFIHALFL
jgi:hypothetical protein